MTEIRQLFRPDVGEIVRIESLCFSSPFSEKQTDGFFDNSHSRFIGLFEDGFLIGYALFYSIDGERELIRIGVLPDFRRKGCADMLLDGVLDGAKKAFLEVRKSNLPAVSLYLKHGFVKAGIRKDYYSSPREDAVMMAYTYADSRN